MVDRLSARSLETAVRDLRNIREKVEVLAGERGNKEKRAVRISYLSRLETLPKLKSERSDDAPTQDEFNDLVDDVHALHDTLSAIAQTLAGNRR